jgi:hypothetical protein
MVVNPEQSNIKTTIYNHMLTYFMQTFLDNLNNNVIATHNNNI